MSWQDFLIFGTMIDNFILYPEIIAEVIKNNEEDIFVLWLFAKDNSKDSNGLVEVKSLIEFCNIHLGIKSNFVYSKITKGIDKYWRKPTGKNGKKKLGLISIDKIIFRLSPNITRSKPVIVPKNLLFCKTKDIRNLFISIVAGRYHDNKPLSMYSLIHNMGISESAIRNAIKDCIYISTYKNYETLAENNSTIALQNILKNHETPWACKIVKTDSSFKLIKQIPNSYELIFKRLPLCKRPKQLKKNDKIMLDNLEPKRYHV